MAYSYCFGLGGNLDFPEFLQKKFYNINYRWDFRAIISFDKTPFLRHFDPVLRDLMKKVVETWERKGTKMEAENQVLDWVLSSGQYDWLVIR